jgi:hypothetical protein
MRINFRGYFAKSWTWRPATTARRIRAGVRNFGVRVDGRKVPEKAVVCIDQLSASRVVFMMTSAEPDQQFGLVIPVRAFSRCCRSSCNRFRLVIVRKVLGECNENMNAYSQEHLMISC